MTPRSIRRAAERKANKAARKAAFNPAVLVGGAPAPACDPQVAPSWPP